MKISTSIPLGKNIRISERHQLREKAREKILSIVSLSMEDLLIDADHKLKDFLDINQTFSHQYSIFLKTLEMGSLFVRQNKVDADLNIPLRNKSGLLFFLPLPWGTEEYNILKPADFVGEAYQTTSADSEFPENKAPVLYTGLVIDARDFEPHPALAPRIYTQDGRLIFGPEFLNANIAIQRGIVAYIPSLQSELLKVRAGNHPMLTSALAITGKYQTDFVISLEDGAKLFDHKQSVINLLKCRVVILVKEQKKG